jgi:CheY-like chemotaxis protein
MLNGFERTPIVAVTAYALREEIKKSIDAGCDAHLTKPIKKTMLIETINTYARV